MIRRATRDDIEAIEALIRRQHAVSSYAGLVEISDKAMRQTMESLIAMQAQRSVGATLCSVAVLEKKIVGFLAAVLQRIYFIGNKLEAMDAFFVNEGRIGDTLELVNSFLAWGQGNPKVLDMKLSWTDDIPGADRIVKLFERKGLSKCGEVWKIRKGGAR